MATRAEKIEKMCSAALAIANNDAHGYSNKVGDNNGSNGDYDCGGFVSEAAIEAGILPAGTMFEPNERYGNAWSYGTVLEAAGFECIPFSYAGVERGDVLIKDGQHTELALGGGRQVGAHSNYDGVRGDYNHKGEISEVALSSYWDYMYRLKGGSTKTGRTVTYRAYDLTLKKWLPEVTSGTSVTDTAGIKGHVMGGLIVRLSKGTAQIRVHTKGAKKWTAKAKAYDTATFAGGYKEIDAVAIKSAYVKYRVKIAATQKWLPWVDSRNYDINDTENGYAGIIGQPIDEIEVKII